MSLSLLKVTVSGVTDNSLIGLLIGSCGILGPPGGYASPDSTSQEGRLVSLSSEVPTYTLFSAHASMGQPNFSQSSLGEPGPVSGHLAFSLVTMPKRQERGTLDRTLIVAGLGLIAWIRASQLVREVTATLPCKISGRNGVNRYN